MTCYSKLAEVCLSQLILFNRKRCGEAERLKLDEFEKGMNAQYEFDEEDLSKVLSKFEMHLVQSHKRIETRGKKARKVPILLPEQLADNIKCLVQHRESAGITNKFLFGKQGVYVCMFSQQRHNDRKYLRQYVYVCVLMFHENMFCITWAIIMFPL